MAIRNDRFTVTRAEDPEEEKRKEAGTLRGMDRLKAAMEQEENAPVVKQDAQLRGMDRLKAAMAQGNTIGRTATAEEPAYDPEKLRRWGVSLDTEAEDADTLEAELADYGGKLRAQNTILRTLSAPAGKLAAAAQERENRMNSLAELGTGLAEKAGQGDRRSAQMLQAFSPYYNRAKGEYAQAGAALRAISNAAKPVLEQQKATAAGYNARLERYNQARAQGKDKAAEYEKQAEELMSRARQLGEAVEGYEALHPSYRNITPEQMGQYQSETFALRSREQNLNEQARNLLEKAERERARYSSWEYDRVSSNPDFSEKSMPDPEMMEQHPYTYGIMGAHTDLGYKDEDYAIINGSQDAYLQSVVNDEEKGYLQHLTDRQKQMYNYFYATEGKSKADQYIQEIKPALTKAEREKNREYWNEYASRQPWGASAFSVLISPLKAISYFGQAADFLRDGEIDPNAAYNKFSQIPGDIRNAVTQDIENKWGKTGSFFYQTGMSMADFLLQSAITGEFAGAGAGLKGAAKFFRPSLAVMGTGAAADTVISLRDRGVDSTRALALGTIAGLAEVVTENVSLETLLNPELLADGTIKYILKNMAAEGSEELGSDVINWAADALANLFTGQKQAEWDAQIKDYVKAGLSTREAAQRVTQDMVMQAALDAAGGALSGGVMAVGGASYHQGNVQIAEARADKQMGRLIQENGDTDALIRQAMQTEGEARQIAETLMDKKSRGRTPGAADLQRLYDALTDAEKARADVRLIQNLTNEAVENAQTLGNMEETAPGAALAEPRSILQAAVNKLASGEQLTQNDGRRIMQDQEAMQTLRAAGALTEAVRNDAAGRQTVRRAVEQYAGQEAAQRAQEAAQQETRGERENVTPGAETARQPGLRLPTAEETLTPAQQPVNLLENNRTEGTNDGQQTAAAGSGTEQAGANVPDRDGGRIPGERAGVQAGRLAGKEWGTLPQPQKAAGRQARANAIGAGAVTARSLGITAAEEESTVRVYPRAEWEPDLQNIAERVEKATGLPVEFIIGSVKVRRGERTLNVRGVNTGGKIIVQADAVGVSAEKIATHEAYHTFARQDPNLSRRVMAEIRRRFPGDNLRQLAELYLEKTQGIVDMYTTDPKALERALEYVQEEICADAYAGINAFRGRADRYMKATRETVAAARSQQNAAATERRTGPPEQTTPSAEQNKTAETGEEARYSTAEEEDVIPQSAAEYAQLKRQGKVQPEKIRKPVQKSQAVQAKADLRKTILAQFSIPAGSRAELGTMIDAMAEQYILNGKITEQDFQALFDRLYETGRVYVQADDAFQSVRELVRHGKIYVPERMKAEWGDDWNSFRKRAWGEGIYITSNAEDSSVDQWWQALSESYPGLFPADEYDPRTMLERMVQLAEEGRGENLSLHEYAAQVIGMEYVSEEDQINNLERQLDWAIRTFGEKAKLELSLRDRTGIKIAQERQRGAELREQAVQRERERGDKRVQAERERGERRQEKAIQAERRWTDRLVQAERADAARGERQRANERIQAERQHGRELLSQERAKEALRRRKEWERRHEVERRQRERRVVRELQQKTLKQLQWMSKNQLKFPKEMQAQVKELLEDMDVLAVSAADEMHIDKATGKTWRDLHDIYLEAQKKDPNWTPSQELDNIVMRLDAKKIEDLDYGELQALYKAAVGLRTELYNRNNVINDEMHRSMNEVYESAKEDIRTAPGKDKEGLLGEYANMQLTPLNRMEQMAGWNPNSAWYSMAKGLEEGERAKRRYETEAAGQLADFLKENAAWVARADGQGKNGIWYELEVPKLLEYHMGDKPIFGNTVKVYMTPAQKVHLYLESKGYDNLRHMEGGRTFANKELYSKGKRSEAYTEGTTIRLAPESVKRIVSDLTPEEQGLADALERYYNGFSKQEINRVSNILYGYDKAMESYYAPIYTNANYNKSTPGIFDLTAEGVGNLKTRQLGSINPTLNISAFDAFEKSVDRTSRFVGLAIPVRNMTNLLNWRERDTSMKDVLGRKWGEQGITFVEDLMTELQNGKQGKKGLDAFIDKTLSKYISSVFGANPSIVLKQFASFPLAGTYLGFEHMPKWIPGAAQVDTALISKYTGELDYRLLGYATPETATLKNNPGVLQREGTLNFLLGGGAITWMDGFTVRTLWTWAENKVNSEQPALEMGTEEQVQNGDSPYYKAVAKEFEEAVSRSQPMYDIMHRSEVMRSSGALGRTFTLFKTVPQQELNMLRQTVGEAAYYKRKMTQINERMETLKSELQNEELSEEDRKKKKAQLEYLPIEMERLKTLSIPARRKAGRAFLGVLMGNMMIGVISFLNALLKNGGKAYRDKEGELSTESVMIAIGKQYFKDAAALTIGGDVAADLLAAALFGDKWYGLETPGIEQINGILDKTVRTVIKTVKLVQDSRNVINNGGDWHRYMEENGKTYVSTAEELARMLVTYGFGIPMDNVKAYLLGVAQTISPTIKIAYEDAMKNADKSGLKGLTGAPLEMRVQHIMQDRAGNIAAGSWESIAALYENGYTKAVPSAIQNSYRVNGEDRSLDAANKQLYSAAWRNRVGGSLDGLTESREFRNADEATQTKILDWLYEIAAQEAKAAVWPDFQPETAIKTAQSLEKQGIPLEEWLPIRAKLAALDADKDKNGKSISGSKKEKVQKYINGLPYSSKQKDALYLADGYQESTLDETPWHTRGGSGRGSKTYAPADLSGLRLPS